MREEIIDRVQELTLKERMEVQKIFKLKGNSYKIITKSALEDEEIADYIICSI